MGNYNKVLTLLFSGVHIILLYSSNFCRYSLYRDKLRANFTIENYARSVYEILINYWKHGLIL